MSESQFKIVLATPLDSRAIWEIRFSDSARAMSGGTPSVSFVDHDRWFNQQYFNQTNNYCFVIKNSDQTIAYCRLDQLPSGGSLVSIAVREKWQNQGLGKLLLKQVIEQKPAPTPYWARIYRQNQNSKRLFVGLGFVLDHAEADVDFYRYN